MQPEMMSVVRVLSKNQNLIRPKNLRVFKTPVSLKNRGFLCFVVVGKERRRKNQEEGLDRMGKVQLIPIDISLKASLKKATRACSTIILGDVKFPIPNSQFPIPNSQFPIFKFEYQKRQDYKKL